MNLINYHDNIFIAYYQIMNSIYLIELLVNAWATVIHLNEDYYVPAYINECLTEHLN